LALGGGAASASTRPVLAGAWTAEERARVESTLLAVPDEVIADAPRVVFRDRATCETDGLPFDDDLLDAQGGAHLCAPGRGDGPLDVGRQVAVALLYGFDRAMHWSDDPGWRRINGWRLSVTHPLRPRPDNVNEEGFVAPRGGRSPRWDLAAFAAAWFAGDPGPACRLLAQATFIGRRLAGLGSPVRAVASCSAFERWADLEHLADVEIVLATPSTAMAASLFGHILLRLVYRDDDGTTPLHIAQTMAFLADNDVPFQADRAYALKGIAGYYTASLHERPFLDAYREYVVLEGRDLRRWRLNLSPGERRDLMERLWTAEHASRSSYYFFHRNCATLMLDLVDQVRPSGVVDDAPGLLAAPPASLLEPLARATGADGAPLLQFVPEPLWSFDHQARITSRHRGDVEARIIWRVERADRPPLRVGFAAAHRGDSGARAAAYQQLAPLLAGRDAGENADVRAWLQDSAAIESHLSTLANLEAEATADRDRHRRLRAKVTELLAGLAAGGLSGERALADVASDDPDLRLAGYRGLLRFVQGAAPSPKAERDDVVARIRLLALLQSEARYDVSRMKSAPDGLRDALLFPDREAAIDQQRYVASQQDLIRVPLETRVSGALLSLQRTRRALFVARRFGDAPGRGEEVGATAATVTLTQRRAYAESLSRSGIDQLAVLAGIAGDGGGGGSPVALLGFAGALYDEQIGDHRRFGFPSDTAMVVGRSRTLVALENGAPALRGYDARLFGYRTVRQTLPESTARSSLGWELYLDVAGNRPRNLAAAPKLGWGLLAPIFDRSDLADHVLVGVGLAYQAYFPGSGGRGGRWQHGLGAPVGLEVRLGLGSMSGYRSWLAGRLWVAPSIVGTGVPRHAIVDAGACLEAHLALRRRVEGGTHDPAVLIRLEAARTALSFDRIPDGTPERLDVIASAGIELR
jgi:hypothetical protein